MAIRFSAHHLGWRAFPMVAALLTACGGGSNDVAPSMAQISSAPTAATNELFSPTASADLSGPEAACSKLKADLQSEMLLRNSMTHIDAASIDVKESGSGKAAINQTGGANVTSAIYHKSGDSKNKLHVGYCEIKGEILPASARTMDGGIAAHIEFAVGLPNPTAWADAGKIAVHLGGSGFDGAAFDVDQQEALASDSNLAPLKTGYVTYGDDAGHQSDKEDDGDKKTDGEFAWHDEEAVRNFGRMSLKKTREVARILMARRYGSVPARSYFLGTSTGGRDALAYLQRWPDDYHGAFVNQPALNYTATRLGNLSIGRRLYGTNRASLSAAWISPEQTIAFQRLVLAECDGLDNAVDGTIGNVKACASQRGDIVSKIRRGSNPVPQGSNWPANVPGLGDEQLASLDFIQADRDLPYTLANGQHSLYGYNLFQGSMFYSVLKDKDSGPVRDRSCGIQAKPSTSTPYGLDKDNDASLVYPGDQWARYFVWRDAVRDWMTTAAKDELFALTSSNGDTIDRIKALSDMTDSSNADLNRFFGHGGRLILMHGLADEVISTRSTVDYHGRVKAAFTASSNCGAIADCLRFYTVPGMGHGKGRYKPSWDALAVLHKWVSSGQAPSGGDLVIDDKGGADELSGKLPGKGTRPLCEYPRYPRFNDTIAKTGASMALAENYTCTAPS